MSKLIELKGQNVRYDLTNFIPMGRYQINDIKNYDEWTDSNYRVHRRYTDSKAQGNITVVFPSIAEYTAFVDFLSTYTSSYNGTIQMDVFCTNTNQVKSITGFLDFEPQNDLPYLGEKKSEGFDITIMESGL